MQYLATALVAFFGAVALVPLVSRLAGRFGAVDRPKPPRKMHAKPVPLWGGIAVLGALALAVFVAVKMGWLPGDHIKLKYLWGLGLAVLLLVIGGSLDDIYDLKPSRQLIWPLAAASVVILSGIGIDYITNPAGGQIDLARYHWTVLWWDGLPYHLTLLADLFTLAWLMGMTYTTKFLDGLDGLVAGITAIGGLVIAGVSHLVEVSQPDTAILGVALAGAYFGFLVFNFNPARVFLGEGGSTIAGFLLGALAIISGGKIATALLILGLPIFDTAAVIYGRWRRRQPIWQGDRTHLHFRLQELGLTARQAALFYWFAAAAFGTSTLVLRGWEKLVAMGLAASILLVVVAAAAAAKRRQNISRQDS